MNIHDVPVAVLAGGLATRLRPITTTVPKAMVEVAGRPFIDHQLKLLHRNGIRKVVLCLGYLGEQVEQHVKDGAGFGLQVRYSYDGEKLLGTGGALRRALPLLGEAFWVLYGDSYLDFDYRAVLAAFAARCGNREGEAPAEPARGNAARKDQPDGKGPAGSAGASPSRAQSSDGSGWLGGSLALPAAPAHGALGLMTAVKNANQWDRSNLIFRDGRLLCYSKRRYTPEMQHIDYGASLLLREAVERLPADQPSDLADLFSTLVAEGRMAGYEMTNRFFEIGSPNGLAETSAYLLTGAG